MAALLVIVIAGDRRGVRGGTIAKLGDGSQVSGTTVVGRFDDDTNVTIWRGLVLQILSFGQTLSLAFALDRSNIGRHGWYHS